MWRSVARKIPLPQGIEGGLSGPKVGMCQTLLVKVLGFGAAEL